MARSTADPSVSDRASAKEEAGASVKRSKSKPTSRSTGGFVVVGMVIKQGVFSTTRK
jgi:hypothetical protein